MAWKNVQYENGKFKTGSGGGGGASTLTDLSDVNISSASDGQVLKYNGTSGKWVNANESGGTVTDVTVDGTSVVNQQGVAEIPAIPDGLHHYSTTEQVVGTWIDGKPLYEKTISFNISGGTNTTSLGVANMGMCLMICAFKVDGVNSTFIPFVDIEAGSSIDSWSVIVYRANLSSGDITYRAASRFAGQTVYATFQYTKTSDA